MQKITEVIRAGGGMPACHFDDAHIKMMFVKALILKMPAIIA